MSINGKWGTSRDGETYSGAFATQEEAIAEARASGERFVGQYRSNPIAVDQEEHEHGDTQARSKTMAKKTTTRKTKATAERPVLVTTAHRGVFFGYATKTNGETIWLRRGRNCIYWSADCKGFLGLAANGPTAGCRIGPAADIELRSVTAVVEVTPAAVERWEAAPWA